MSPSSLLPSDRLYWGQVGYLRTRSLAGAVVLWGPAIIALGVGALATTTHITAAETGVDFVVVGLGVFMTGYMTPRAWKRLIARGRNTGPYLEVRQGVLRFQRGSGPSAEIEVAKVARAEHTYRMANPYARGGGRLSVLRFFDSRGESLATWNLWPLQGRAVARWLTHQGVTTTVSRD